MLTDNTGLDELDLEEEGEGTKLDTPGCINPDPDDAADEEDVEDIDKVVPLVGTRSDCPGGGKSSDCVALEVVSEVSEGPGSRSVPGGGGIAPGCVELVEDAALSSIETEGVGFAEVSRVTWGIPDDSSPEGVGFADVSSVTWGVLDDSFPKVELVGSSAGCSTADEDSIGFGWNEIEKSLKVVLDEVVDEVRVELDETEVLRTKSSNVDDVELDEVDVPLGA
ncbi:hypothetical protein BFW01_g1249 [Lasiodiplodia theobromae]|uniref:Uncharacterized protein n=1 Tax=Lasiodiplodia theobromae TaxID=45133 RepID=A0A8H7IRY3_9PEZI|nr:hypothetical protein BFW01_g1249 [Lasiodiplodia theobromae]